MTEHLIALSVGPVQGFIAAARRTRDLWFGSHVLSEVGKAAAKAFHDYGARLIFPAPMSADDLDPESDLNVGNKILAAAATDAPENLLKNVKDTARTRWRDIAESVLEKLKTDIRSDIWHRQVENVLELYGAWVLIGDGSNSYANARNRLERLLNARKGTRNFEPAAASFHALPGFGLPKSSLDGAGETVLIAHLSKKTRHRLGLASGEQLDCPGVVKRFGGNPEQFPPVTRIALEAWLENIPCEALADVSDAFDRLVPDLASRVSPGRFSRLPYDGGLLFPSRIEAETAGLEEDQQGTKPFLSALKAVRERLYKKHGPPTPYFAVLVADGDHMGPFIDGRTTKEDHISLTKALARFAGEARNIVEKHQGACVYAGGDDVLAFLPIHQAINCARKLYNTFSEDVGCLVKENESPPTLSVGLGLGHVLTPFNRLLDLGRRAERLAKDGNKGTPREQQRNALAIIVGVRSGAEVAVRGRWDVKIDERLEQWMRFYQEDRLSDKTPYDLRQASMRTSWAYRRSDYKIIASREASRVLTKKRAAAGEQELSDEVKKAVVEAIDEYGTGPVVDGLLVARWLAQKAKE